MPTYITQYPDSIGYSASAPSSFRKTEVAFGPPRARRDRDPIMESNEVQATWTFASRVDYKNFIANYFRNTPEGSLYNVWLQTRWSNWALHECYVVPGSIQVSFNGEAAIVSLLLEVRELV